jgi:hypothetical protein
VPFSLLLGILVWDGVDEVVALAVLVDLARVPLDDDLSTSISVSARRSTADRSSHASEGEAVPFVDARMADGSRVHAVLGTLASPGTCVSLRVPVRRSFSLEDCVCLGLIDSRHGAAPVTHDRGQAGRGREAAA